MRLSMTCMAAILSLSAAGASPAGAHDSDFHQDGDTQRDGNSYAQGHNSDHQNGGGYRPASYHCDRSKRHAGNEGTALGAVSGGAMGGIIGHSVPGALVGAGVGAVAGHQIAKSRVHC